MATTHSLPKKIRDMLAGPCPASPGRHDAMREISAQMVANGFSDDETFTTLRQWCSDRDKSDKEIHDLIKGAHRLGFQPTQTRAKYERPPDKPKVKRYEPTGERMALPEALEHTASRYLAAIFAPDEIVSIERKAGNGWEGKTLTVTEWCDAWIGSGTVYEPDGVYYCINPLTGNKRDDSHVKDLRNGLVELEVAKDDRARMSPEEKDAACEVFYAAFLGSGLPLRAVYTSGDASVHGLVAIDAKSAAEFKERIESVYDFASTMPGFDKANKNPSRLSRLPGAYRGEQLQALLYLNPGARWEQWTPEMERLFKIESLSELIREDPPLPPVLIDNWLHKSSIGMLTGSMKTNKSWTLMDLSICFSEGLEWLGKKCSQTTVMYFDAEIQRSFWQKRFRLSCRQRDLDPQSVADHGRILPVFVAGKDVTIKSLHEELKRMHERGELESIDVIIIDPIYQFYEADWEENSNEDVAKLGRYLRFISEFSGIGTIFAHHHTKGNQEGKRDIEKASGGGSFGRFVASSLAITYLGEDNTNRYTLGWTTSHFKPTPKQVAVREDFTWVITDEDPNDANLKHPPGECLNALQDGMNTREWADAVGCDIRMIKNRAKKLAYIGSVIFRESDETWELSPSAATKKHKGNNGQ